MFVTCDAKVFKLPSFFEVCFSKEDLLRSFCKLGKIQPRWGSGREINPSLNNVNMENWQKIAFKKLSTIALDGVHKLSSWMNLEYSVQAKLEWTTLNIWT